LDAAVRLGLILSLLSSALLVGIGPCGAVPGGGLDFEITQPPERWDAADDGQCHLEVRPEDPTSIKVDCYVVDGGLYVHSHRFVDWWRAWGEAWVNAVERDPDVRIVRAGRLYELRMQRILEPRRTEILISRGFDPVPEPIRLFQLEARR
jgi:hypothetical protein